MERRVRYLDLLIIRIDHFHEIDISRKPTTNYRKSNNYTKFIITFLITYLLTPWCKVLLEKLTGLQLVKEFPAFHGTRRFITALTSVRHLSLSWASPFQSIYPHSTSWRFILILFTHLRLGLPVVSFPPVSPPRPYTPPSPHPYAPHAQPISFFSILSPAQYWVSTDHFALLYAISSTGVKGGGDTRLKIFCAVQLNHGLVSATGACECVADPWLRRCGRGGEH